jgi:hypothetical protein
MAREPWKLTVRLGPKVERSRHRTLVEALGAADAALRRAERRPDRRLLGVREVPSVGQVAARAELAGPGRRHGGLDVRGDGSLEAYTGRVRKRPLEPWPGEDPVDALLRTLGEA